MRGWLIVLEGIDRSGKSTQAKIIGEKYLPCFRMSFPNRETIIAQIINNYLTTSMSLDDNSIHLLFSANRWESKDKILNEINAGNNVLLDRYAYSGVAYSAAKGLDFEWCKASDQGLPKPDLVIYMNIDPQNVVGRGNYGEERYEKVDFQVKVARQFEKLMEQIDNCVVIDANKSQEEISQEIQDAIQRINLSKPLSKLW